MSYETENTVGENPTLANENKNEAVEQIQKILTVVLPAVKNSLSAQQAKQEKINKQQNNKDPQ